MRCPGCGVDDDRVIDSRPSSDGESIRRRRACNRCGDRFTTWERVELPPLSVRKRNGALTPFDRGRVYAGMRNACAGRGVADATLEQAAWEIERELRDLDVAVVTTVEVGQLVMRRLRELDAVGYVRFASVYEDFQGADDFEQVILSLRESGDIPDQIPPATARKPGPSQPI